MLEGMSFEENLNSSLSVLLSAVENDDLEKLYAILEIPRDLLPNHEDYHEYILQKLTDIFESVCETYSHKNRIGSCQKCSLNGFCPVCENSFIHSIAENIASYLINKDGLAREEVVKSLRGITEALDLKSSGLRLN